VREPKFWLLLCGQRQARLLQLMKMWGEEKGRKGARPGNEEFSFHLFWLPVTLYYQMISWFQNAVQLGKKIRPSEPKNDAEMTSKF
jgi:hypothetical protein